MIAGYNIQKISVIKKAFHLVWQDVWQVRRLQLSMILNTLKSKAKHFRTERKGFCSWPVCLVSDHHGSPLVLGSGTWRYKRMSLLYALVLDKTGIEIFSVKIPCHECSTPLTFQRYFETRPEVRRECFCIFSLYHSSSFRRREHLVELSPVTTTEYSDLGHLTCHRN